VCRTSAERTSTRPSSKQRLAPRLPVWCSKVALNGSTRRKAGTRLGPVPILFVLLVELPVSGRYWPCTIVRVFFFAPFHTKRATFSVCGAHCGACSARILRKFSLNVHALCMRRCWGGFGGVGLPLLQIVFSARAFCSCLPCGQRRRVFWHIKVPRRGQGRVTSSQMVTAARSCAYRRAWLRLERGCAMMRSLKGSETVLRGGEFLCFSEYSGATRPGPTCIVRR